MMPILRTAIWVLFTAVLVGFAAANWDPVSVTIWPGWVLETKKPMLALIAFLLGFLPMWLASRSARWSLQRRIESSDRQLADVRNQLKRATESEAATAPAPSLPPPDGPAQPSLLDTP